MSSNEEHFENGIIHESFYNTQGILHLKRYYKDGIAHNENGPAIEWCDEEGYVYRRYYYLNGVLIKDPFKILIIDSINVSK
jgi:hypothetical protein